MKIQVYIRNTYGNLLVYIADTEQAATVRKLTGSKTLTVEHTEALTALGFTFEQVPDPRAPKLGAELFAIGLSGLPSNPQA